MTSAVGFAQAATAAPLVNASFTTASEYVVPVGTPVDITVRAVFTADEITILRYLDDSSGAYLNNCLTESVCETTVSYSTPTVQRFYGVVDSGKTNEVVVAWVESSGPSGVPSDQCTSLITDTTIAANQVKISTKSSASEIDVCVRVNTLVGEGAGGMLAVKLPSAIVDPGELPQPDRDEDAGACATAPGNLNPVHPLFSTNTGGVTLAIDAYVSASAVWICVDTNLPDGDIRVIQPIEVPNAAVLPGLDVDFYPDPA